MLSQESCLQNLTQLPPLDLLQLVDEWEKENSHRIIRTDRRDSGVVVKGSETESKSCKMSVPAQDLRINKSRASTEQNKEKSLSAEKSSVMNAVKSPKDKIVIEKQKRRISEETEDRSKVESGSKMEYEENLPSEITVPLPRNKPAEDKGTDLEDDVMSDDSDFALLPSQANFTLDTTVKGQHSDNHKSEEEAKNSSRTKTGSNLTHGQKEDEDKEHETDDEKGEEDVDNFMNTQATFMLTSADDFLLAEQCETDGDTNGVTAEKKSDDSKNGKEMEGGYAEKTKDRIVQGFGQKRLDDNEKSEKDAKESHCSDSADSQFTFTQALACIHSSEEILENEGERLDEVDGGTSVEIEKQNGASVKSQKSLQLVESKDGKGVALGSTKSNQIEPVTDDSNGSLEDVGNIFPSFDLGFDLNEDIIPPSPCASQSSQKSFSKTLSQSLLLSRKSLAMNDTNLSDSKKTSTVSALDVIQEDGNEKSPGQLEKDADNSAEDTEKKDRNLGNNGLNILPLSPAAEFSDDDFEMLYDDNCETSDNDVSSIIRNAKRGEDGDLLCNEKTVEKKTPDIANKMDSLNRNDNCNENYKENSTENHSKINMKDISENCDENNSKESIHVSLEDLDFEQQLALAMEESLKTAAKEIFPISSNVSSVSPVLSSQKRRTKTKNISLPSPSSDLDDSFVVRKKKKVAIFESPETPSTEIDHRDKGQLHGVTTPARPACDRKKKPCIRSTSSEDDSFQGNRKKPSIKSASSEDDSFLVKKKKTTVCFDIPDLSDEDDFEFDSTRIKSKEKKMREKQPRKGLSKGGKSRTKSPADKHVYRG